MNKEYVLVPKKEFQALVSGYLFMSAGEMGGVDNWEWWGESVDDFIKSYNEGNDTEFKDMDEVVEDFVNSYKTIIKEEE